MSANTGFAPSALTALPVATKVNGGRITSSPELTPTARNAKMSASVPDATPTPCCTPHSSATSRSSAAPSLPSTNCCDASTFATASRISAPIAAYCAARSICGTACNSVMKCRVELMSFRAAVQYTPGAARQLPGPPTSANVSRLQISQVRQTERRAQIFPQFFPVVFGDGQKHFDDFGIELCSSAPLDLFACVGHRKCFAVRPVADHCVHAVGN